MRAAVRRRRGVPRGQGAGNSWRAVLAVGHYEGMRMETRQAVLITKTAQPAQRLDVLGRRRAQLTRVIAELERYAAIAAPSTASTASATKEPERARARPS